MAGGDSDDYFLKGAVQTDKMAVRSADIHSISSSVWRQTFQNNKRGANLHRG